MRFITIIFLFAIVQFGFIQHASDIDIVNLAYDAQKTNEWDTSLVPMIIHVSPLPFPAH